MYSVKCTHSLESFLRESASPKVSDLFAFYHIHIARHLFTHGGCTLYFGKALTKFSEVTRQNGGKVHLDQKIDELDAEYMYRRTDNQ